METYFLVCEHVVAVLHKLLLDRLFLSGGQRKGGEHENNREFHGDNESDRFNV